MANASPKALIVFHGDAEIRKRRALELLVRERLADGDPEYGLERLWGGETTADRIAGALGGFSLLAEERVVVIHDMHELPNKEQKRLASALSNIPDGTTVVITTTPPEGRFDRKPRLAADLLKVVDKVGEVREMFTPREQELVPWLAQEAGLVGKRLGPSAARLLLETVGADCDRLAAEVGKLAVYMGEEAEISEAAIRDCASPADDTTVFDLVDAIGQKNLPEALELVRALLPREARRGSGIPLLGMIARQLRLLWQAVVILKHQASLDSKPPPEVAATLPSDTTVAEAVRGKPFVARKLTAQARNFTEAQLARALVKVYEADLALKGYGDGSQEDRLVIETLVIALCRR